MNKALWAGVAALLTASVTALAVGLRPIAEVRADPPAAPFAALANQCATFTSARIAFDYSTPQRRREMLHAHNRNVLRVASDGRMAIDGGAHRFTWHPGSHLMYDGWTGEPRDWSSHTSADNHIEELWSLCRSGFSGVTWSGATQDAQGWYADAALPYPWAADVLVRIRMWGGAPAPTNLGMLTVYPAAGAVKDALLQVSFEVVEWNVQLSAGALDPDLAEGVSAPIPKRWTCTKYSDWTCWNQTGWVPATSPPDLGTQTD